MKRTLVFFTTLSAVLFGFTSSVDAAGKARNDKTKQVTTSSGRTIERTVVKQQGSGRLSRMRDEVRYGAAATERAGLVRITGGGLAGVDIASGDGSTLTTTTIQIGAGYIRPNGLEFGADFRLLTSSGLSARTTELLILPTLGYNFGFGGVTTRETLNDAAYVRLGVGLFIATSSGDTDSYFTLRPTVGKRFALAPGISWSPELSFQLIAAEPAVTRIGITPLSFTFLF